MFASQHPDNTDDVDDDASDDDSDDMTMTVDIHSAQSERESQPGFEYSLPHHQHCACHTLNLIATTDANKAEDDAHYKSQHSGHKCHAL